MNWLGRALWDVLAVATNALSAIVGASGPNNPAAVIGDSELEGAPSISVGVSEAFVVSEEELSPFVGVRRAGPTPAEVALSSSG